MFDINRVLNDSDKEFWVVSLAGHYVWSAPVVDNEQERDGWRRFVGDVRRAIEHTHNHELMMDDGK